VPPIRIELRLEKLDRTALFDGHNVETKFPEPCLDIACARGVSEHPGATQHRNQGILAQTSTRHT